MITKRQSQILDALIREYVAAAQPVSSKFLFEKYDFGLSPAGIRIEMQKLAQDGYLSQPHTSAGRVPTDKGYRFFVNNLLERKESKKARMENLLEDFIKERMQDNLRLITQLTQFLANKSSTFIYLHLKGRDLSLTAGWEGILREPEFLDQSNILNFTQLLEKFEDSVEEMDFDSDISIFIGEEAPFFRNSNFSIISSKCHLPDREEGIVSLLGPKRMDYYNNIYLINSLKRKFEELL